jgi:hypothetical protein
MRGLLSGDIREPEGTDIIGPGGFYLAPDALFRTD